MPVDVDDDDGGSGGDGDGDAPSGGGVVEVGLGGLRVFLVLLLGAFAVVDVDVVAVSVSELLDAATSVGWDTVADDVDVITGTDVDVDEDGDEEEDEDKDDDGSEGGDIEDAEVAAGGTADTSEGEPDGDSAALAAVESLDTLIIESVSRSFSWSPCPSLCGRASVLASLS